MKTILITGSTDGIGLVTAKALLERGHRVLIHGRSEQKVNGVVAELATLAWAERVAGFVADLSDLAAIDSLASEVLAANASLDVLINNAGVFLAPSVVTADGLDLRFVVTVDGAGIAVQGDAEFIGGLLRAFAHLHEERVGVGLGDQAGRDILHVAFGLRSAGRN